MTVRVRCVLRRDNNNPFRGRNGIVSSKAVYTVACETESADAQRRSGSSID